ncbi:MAG: toxic anion resistance protein [Eubacteriales bacterium]|nr:toxic anion resistance protein [Eubacteriales bacterium]
MNQKISLADLAQNQAARHSAEAELKQQQELADAALMQRESRELSPEDRQKVDSIKAEVNLLDSQNVVTYGVGAQRQLTNFSEQILAQVQSKDAGQIGDTLTDLSVSVRSLDIQSLNKDNFWSHLPWVNNLRKFMAKYETVELQVDKIEAKLDESINVLLRDIGIFDTLFEKNLTYYKELGLYIQAGEEIVKEAREVTIPALLAEAQASEDQMAAQLVKDFEDTINRFEQKVHNLKLSRTIAMQTVPQIRLIQNNDKLLIDKVQTALNHTLPLWKNQIVIALGLRNQKNVLELNRKITDTTNQFLKENSELLRQNTVEVAKETQRGIVDIETLKQVNQDLIETIDETMTIQKQGREARQSAELELAQIESDLRANLLKHIQKTDVNIPTKEAGSDL